MEIEELHRIAVKERKETYIDPETGYTVFTAVAHEKRGRCCGRACRHCPYGHFNVKDAKNRLAPMPMKPTWLRVRPAAPPINEELNILFWSGGKDSYLTFLELKYENTILLTTYDPLTGEVPEQNIPLTTIFEQAHALKTDLIAVPTLSGNYKEDIFGGISLVMDKRSRESVKLCFGDLHLEDLRKWRESNFLDYTCMFPIFSAAYPILMQKLFSNPHKAKIYFSAINNDQLEVKVGDELTESVMNKLMKEGKCVAFGEHGEFHTEVRFLK